MPLPRCPTIFPSLLEAIIFYELEIKPTHKLDGHYEMLTKEGRLIMYGTGPDEIAIYGIWIKDGLQRQGRFTHLIKFLQEEREYRKIVIYAADGAVDSCVSKIVHGGRCFVNHGGDMIWARSEEYCFCHEVDQKRRVLVKR